MSNEDFYRAVSTSYIVEGRGSAREFALGILLGLERPTKILVTALFLLTVLVVAATAQDKKPEAAVPVSDSEIAAAWATCNQPDHIFPRRDPENRHGYKPGWEHCVAIDAEYAKRDLARKQKAADDAAATKAVIDRLNKAGGNPK